MRFGALLLVAGAAIVSAQGQQQYNVQDIPQCGLTCLTNNVQQASGCQLLDISCQCMPDNRAKIAQVVTPCVTGSCNFFEGLTVQNITNGLCEQAGFPASMSGGSMGGAATSSGSGGSSSSSSQQQPQEQSTQGGGMVMTAMPGGTTPTVNPYLGTDGLSYTGPNIPSTPTYAQPTAYTGAAEPLHVAGSFGGAVVAVAAALAL